MGGASEAVETLSLEVRGLHCMSCVKRLTAALTAAPGVQGAEVDLLASRATVRFETGASSEAAIAAVIEGAGYVAGARME